MSYLGRDVREVAGPVFCEGGEELDHDDDEVRKLDGIESAVLLRLVLVFDVLEFVEDLESVLPVVDFVRPLLCNGRKVLGEEALGAFQGEEADDNFRLRGDEGGLEGAFRGVPVHDQLVGFVDLGLRTMTITSFIRFPRS